MDSERKMKFFKKLVGIGYKEIEVGFPSSSETDFNFVRELILDGHIPSEVTIQVLTQSREELINKTIESLEGCEMLSYTFITQQALYKKSCKENMEGVKKIATDGAKIIRNNVSKLNKSNIRFEYSPESFTGTELEYALDV